MRWQYLLAIVAGVPVGFYLGLWFIFWRSEQYFTRQQARLDALLTQADAAISQVEAIVRPPAVVDR